VGEPVTDDWEMPLDEEVERIESSGCALEAIGLEAAAAKKRRRTQAVSFFHSLFFCVHKFIPCDTGQPSPPLDTPY